MQTNLMQRPRDDAETLFTGAYIQAICWKTHTNQFLQFVECSSTDLATQHRCVGRAHRNV